jgi:hypothetical protein
MCYASLGDVLIRSFVFLISFINGDSDALRKPKASQTLTLWANWATRGQRRVEEKISVENKNAKRTLTVKKY